MNRSLLFLLAVVTPTLAGPEDAVVRIPSHGISGTVIWTTQGKSYILTCAHGHMGNNKSKPISVDVPAVQAGAPKRVGIRLAGIDYQADLALIEFGDGPLNVCPVGPADHQPSRETRSVGYDEMKWPATNRPAHILTAYTWTRERPWHGRSGGALIDTSGYLVGVCHGYTGPRDRQEVLPGAQGMYVSHATVLRFLASRGWGNCGSEQRLPQQKRGAPWQLQSPT